MFLCLKNKHDKTKQTNNALLLWSYMRKGLEKKNKNP